MVDVAEETRTELASMGVELYFKPLALRQIQIIVQELVVNRQPRAEAT